MLNQLHLSACFLSLPGSFIVGLIFHRIKPNTLDIVVFGLSVFAVYFAAKTSPWKTLKSSTEWKEFEFAHPDVDLSTPSAMISGLAGGTIVLSIAATADATGFGVFMASATALGQAGASFTTIHTAMSALGILLAPAVYIPLSIGTSLLIIWRFIKTGNSFLCEAITSIHLKDWNTAYSAVYNASKKKWLLKPSKEKINLWYKCLQNQVNVRDMELDLHETTLNNLATDPRKPTWIQYKIGIAVGFILGLIIFAMGAGALAIFSSEMVMGFILAERYLPSKIAFLLERVPQLHTEISALIQLSNIQFTGHHKEITSRRVIIHSSDAEKKQLVP